MHRRFSAIAVIIFVLLSAVAGFILSGAAAHAQAVHSGDNLTVPASKTIDSSYFAGGRSIDIGGTVNGDVICGTQDLTVSGTVHGDVVCGAQNITITGRVDGSVRLAGQSITLDGTIGKNASVIGQSLNVGGKASVGGDLSFAGSTLTHDGAIGRDMAAAVQTAVITGSIKRNVTMSTAKLTVANTATVGGTINYTSANKALIASGANVGSVQQHQPVEQKHERRSWRGLGFFLLWFVLAALFCSLILVLIMPLFFWTTSQEAVSRPWWTLLFGFLTGIVLPVVTLIAFATVIGIPLGFLLLLFGFMLLLLSFPVSAFFLGRLLFATWMNRNHNAVVLMVLGALALIVLLLIPFINIIAWILMVWFGSGSLILALGHRLVRPTYSMPETLAAKP